MRAASAGRQRRRAELIRIGRMYWQELTDAERTLVREEILRALRMAPSKGLSATEVAEELDLSDDNCRESMMSLGRYRQIFATKDDRWHFTNTGATGN